CGGGGCWKIAIREYSFKGWNLCGSLALQPVTSNSAYRNRMSVHITSLEHTVRKTSPIYTKKYAVLFKTFHCYVSTSFSFSDKTIRSRSFACFTKCRTMYACFLALASCPASCSNVVKK